MFALKKSNEVINYLLKEGYEASEGKSGQLDIYDSDNGKESILRIDEKYNKKKIILEILDTNGCAINKEKIVELLSTLDDTLFQNAQKIVFIDTEKSYENVMAQFENTDMIDFDEELGKYLFFEDWVIVNLHAIRETVTSMGYDNQRGTDEVNIGIWTTLIHELRHTYQHSPLFDYDQKEEFDIEEDAEFYALSFFEDKIINKDYIVTI